MTRLIRDIMDTRIVRVSPSDSLELACDLLRESKSSIVVVEWHGRAVGLLTERDVVRMIHDGVDAASCRTDEVMNSPVSVIEESASLFDAHASMIRKRFRHLVVVDGDGTMSGVLTQTDMLAGMGMEYFVELRDVASIMTRNMVRVRPGDSMRLAVDLMHANRISCVVVEENWMPVGIITERDVVRMYSKDFCADTVQVQQVMSSPVRSVQDSTFLPEVNMIMQQEKLRHMVVVDGHGRLAGLLSLSDITACLETGYIAYLQGVIERKSEQIGRLAREHGALIRANPNPVFALDSKGNISDANAAALQLSECSLGALRGREMLDLLDEEMAVPARQRFAEACRGSASHGELRIVRESGGRVDVFASFLPVSGEDGVFRVYAVLHDVTRHKQAERMQAEHEQRFRVLAGLAGAVCWEMDVSSGRFSMLDQRIERLLGYATDSWQDVDVWMSRVAGGHREYMQAMLESVRQSRQARHFVCNMRHADGVERGFTHYVSAHCQRGGGYCLSGFMLPADGEPT